MEKIKIHLPEFYLFYPIYYELFRILKDKPNWMNSNMEIGSVYGCFPGCIWNGGRVMHGSCSREDISEIICFYNEQDIPLRFTFTNSLLTNEMLLDTFGNMIMELANNGMNQVVINSEVLENHIRMTYPRFKLISSTTKCLNLEKGLMEELEKDYYLVVLDYSLNNTIILESISRKEKCEILLNAYCYDNCQRRLDHYKAISRDQIYRSDDSFGNCDSLCRNFYQLFTNKSFVSLEKIYEKYYPAGYRHFKIEGRSNNVFDVIESLLYYLIIPEHRDYVRLHLLKSLTDDKMINITLKKEHLR